MKGGWEYDKGKQRILTEVFIILRRKLLRLNPERFNAIISMLELEE
jgi:hypothetical protein